MELKTQTVWVRHNDSEHGECLKKQPEMYMLTREEMQEVLGKTFEAGMQNQWERDNLLNAEHPNKEQFISSHLKMK